MVRARAAGGNKSFTGCALIDLLKNNIFVDILKAMDASILDDLRSTASRACALLRVLAHEDRLVLLCRLAEREHTVGELEQALGIVQPTLSQQLGVLRREGLVDTRRDGKYIHYRIASEDALAVMQTLHARFCADTDNYGDTR
jgi:DNA-binding transcriptional ArsR family regulator